MAIGGHGGDGGLTGQYETIWDSRGKAIQLTIGDKIGSNKAPINSK